MAKKMKKPKKTNRKVAPKEVSRRARKVIVHAPIGPLTTDANIPAGRDNPNPRLSRGTSDDPTGNRLALKIAGCAPDRDVGAVLVQLRVSKIDEAGIRFEGWPISMFFETPPDVKVGDTLVLCKELPA